MMQQQTTLPYSFLRRVAGFTQTGLMLAVLAAFFCAASAFMPGPAEQASGSAGSLPDTIVTKICAGESFIFGEDTLTASGIYSHTLVGSDGGDSIVTLNLNVLPVSVTTLVARICEGSTYVFGGDTLSTAGTYADTLSGANGCDSIRILKLGVQAFFDDTLHASICPGDSYQFGNHLVEDAGVYTDSLKAAGGCDSVVTLVLEFIPVPQTSIDAVICANETYVFAGATLHLPGIYTDTLTSALGCDSIVTLLLKVLPVPETDLTVKTCANEPYDFNGTLLTQPGVYTDTLTAENGCDSLVILTLNVLPVTTTLLSARICEGSNYPFDGGVLIESGTYVDTLSDENGCDSVLILKLSVQAFFDDTLYVTICPGDSFVFGADTVQDAGIYTDSLIAEGGCDSTVTLVLEFAPIPHTTIQASICANETYAFGSEILQLEGTYVDTLISSFGCDSIVTLKLDVLPLSDSAFSATICANEPFDFNGTLLSLPGVYTDTLTAENGCDSLVTLTLNVLPISETSLEATVCAFQTYEFHGQFLDESGNYTDTLTAENGCDSLVTLHLTVLPELISSLDAAICTGQTYDFFGQTLDSTGTYSMIFTAVNGCDSVVLLHLQVYLPVDSALQATICANDGFVFGNDTLSLPGIYTDTLTAFTGCDSIVTLTLNVLPLSDSALTATICANETFEFNGALLHQSGIYLDTLSSVNGCDSLVTLTLNVLPVAGKDTSAAICAGENFVFEGQILTESGIYHDTLTAENGCDSIITLTLVVHPAQNISLSAQICQGISYLFNNQLLTESGIYTAVYPDVNGCDSTTTLTLEVLPPLGSTEEATICAGETYAFNGLALDASGIYMASYTTAGGCDSIVTLSLTVRPANTTTFDVAICPGETYAFNGQNIGIGGQYTALGTDQNGCDSTVVLNLSILPIAVGEISATICANETFNFNGQILNQSGNYTATLTGSNGCDSTANLVLTVLPVKTSALNATICANETYPFNGQALNQGGIYTANLTAANGCDSTVTLTLTVLPVQSSTLNATICQGETYAYNGGSYTQSGNYPFVFTAVNGCDSLVMLHLVVLPPVTTTLSFAICQGTNLNYNGTTLTQTGSYPFLLTSVYGCDSTVIVNLTVTPSPSTTLNYTICEGTTLVYEGDTLSQSGNYDYFFVGSTGCDSTVIIHLSILPATSTTLDESICAGESYNFGGQILNQSGTYSAALQTIHGCDSLVTLHLTVLPVAASTITATICEGDTYPFSGLNLTQAGIYTASFISSNGCDSTVTLLLTVNSLQYSIVLQSGTITVQANNATYQWINCDTNQPIPGQTGATFTPGTTGNYAVIVTQNGCSAQSNCLLVEVVATGEPGFTSAWTIQPNPATDRADIQLTAPATQDLDVALFDLNGRLLQRFVLPQGSTALTMELSDLPQGVVLVKMTDGKQTATKRLVVTGK